MQNVRSHLRSTRSETPGWAQQSVFLTSPRLILRQNYLVLERLDGSGVGICEPGLFMEEHEESSVVDLK